MELLQQEGRYDGDMFVEEYNEEVVGLVNLAIETKQAQEEVNKLMQKHVEQVEHLDNETTQIYDTTEDGLFTVADAARLAGQGRTLKAAATGAVVGGVVGTGVGVLGGPPGMVAGAAGGATLFGVIGGGVAKVFEWRHNKIIDSELMEHEHKKKFIYSENCQKCGSHFNFIKHRHYCRICGSSVCRSCSSSKVSYRYRGIPEPKNVRACDPCFKTFENTKI